MTNVILHHLGYKAYFSAMSSHPDLSATNANTNKVSMLQLRICCCLQTNVSLYITFMYVFIDTERLVETFV